MSYSSIDSYRDYDKILHDKLLVFDGYSFVWKQILPIDGKIVGLIQAWKEDDENENDQANILIDVCLIKNEFVIYRYKSYAQHDIECIITWQDENQKVCYMANFYNDEIIFDDDYLLLNQQFPFNIVDNLIGNKDILPNKLEILDESHILKI